MARSKGISYGSLLVKNLYTTHISTHSRNTQILKDTVGFRLSCQARRPFCNVSGNQELPPTPPPSSSNWGKWTAGIGIALTTMVIPLLQFKGEVDEVMETAEEIIDLVEVVAEAVDMVAEKIADDLTDGSNLKSTMETIEDVMETVTEKAQKLEDFIDKVQEAEQKLGPVIEPVKQVTQVTPSEPT